MNNLYVVLFAAAIVATAASHGDAQERIPIAQGEQGGFVRTVPLEAEATPLARVWLTVVRRDVEQLSITGGIQLRKGVTTLFEGWPVPDAIHEELQVGPQGQPVSYLVLIATGRDGRKAILGVYKNPRPVLHGAPERRAEEAPLPPPPLPVPEAEATPVPRRPQGPALVPEELQPGSVLPQGNPARVEEEEDAPKHPLRKPKIASQPKVGSMR